MQRMILEARAFAALKQWDNALDLIAVDQADDTKRLRADIYWESGNWAVAGQKTEELLGARWSDPAPLSDAERVQVLRMAVAYSLANDEASLDAAARAFRAQDEGHARRQRCSRCCRQRSTMHGLAFRDAAAKIASVDTLEAFMKDFSKRIAPTPRAVRLGTQHRLKLRSSFRLSKPVQRAVGQTVSQPGSPISQWLMPCSIS